MIKREASIFLTALMFYTRIPCPKWIDHNADYLNQATRYFPLIGWIVGCICWLTFLISHYLLSNELSIVLSMIAGVLTTGAFHEDGFADVCDGFGGGWTREKILLIMKDSRVGTYGVVGLILLFGLKFYALLQISSIDNYCFGLCLILAHALSRLAAVGIIFSATYARDEADSKAKPVAQQRSTSNLLVATVWAIIPLSALAYYNILFLSILIPVVAITFYLRWYYIKWIGGYTGDGLGATQQIAEVIIYLSLLAVWKFI